MHTAQPTIHAPILYTALVTLRARADAIIKAVAVEMRARKTMHELSELSDRTLEDIGLRRDQIEQASRRAYW